MMPKLLHSSFSSRVWNTSPSGLAILSTSRYMCSVLRLSQGKIILIHHSDFSVLSSPKLAYIQDATWVGGLQEREMAFVASQCREELRLSSFYLLWSLAMSNVPCPIRPCWPRWKHLWLVRLWSIPVIERILRDRYQCQCLSISIFLSLHMPHIYIIFVDWISFLTDAGLYIEKWMVVFK